MYVYLDGRPVPNDLGVVKQTGTGKPIVFKDDEWIEVKWVDGSADDDDDLEVIRASDVKIRPVEWLDRDRIALRALNLVAGEGGMGKSTLAADRVARATRGQLNGRFRGDPVNVLWIGTEDGREDVIVPRLRMAGADLGRVFFVKAKSTSLADGINIVSDIDKVKSLCERHGAKLVVLDPVVEYLPSKTDSHNDLSVRQALRPLGNLAEEISIAVLGLVHFNKGATLHVATRIVGSAGFRNAARSVLVVADHPEEEKAKENWRVVFQNKSNWGPEDHRGHVYRAEGIEVVDNNEKVILDHEGKPFTTARIVWGGEVEIDPRSLPFDNGEREKPKRDAATETLRVLLRDRPRLKSEIEAEAKREDIGWRTVERAADEMEVETRQMPVPGKRGAGPSWWALPGRCEWSATPPVYRDGGPLKEDGSPGQQGFPDVENEWSATRTEAETDAADLKDEAS